MPKQFSIACLQCVERAVPCTYVGHAIDHIWRVQWVAGCVAPEELAIARPQGIRASRTIVAHMRTGVEHTVVQARKIGFTADDKVPGLGTIARPQRHSS